MILPYQLYIVLMSMKQGNSQPDLTARADIPKVPEHIDPVAVFIANLGDQKSQVIGRRSSPTRINLWLIN